LFGGENMIKRRGLAIAAIVKDDPRLLLKLSTTSFVLSMAAMKLCAFQQEILNDLKKDLTYKDYIEDVYAFWSDLEKDFAESFAGVSAEMDKLLPELKIGDEQE
jgi:hypothetical protein